MTLPHQLPTQSARLAVVVSHPIQYYSPWFRFLAKNTGLPLRVFYLDDSGLKAHHDERFQKSFAWDVDLTSGYEHEFVPNRAPRKSTLRFTGLFNPGLPGRLELWKPDAVLVFGYNYISHILLMRWARCARIPLIFRGDSHLLHRSLAPAKRCVLSLVYRQFAAVTYVGEANRQYFLTLGVTPERLFHAPHAVDADFFEKDSVARLAKARELRTSLAISTGQRVILFAGKLVADKRPDLLLEAFIRLAPENASLVFLGDGELKTALENRAKQAPVAVHFLPFANQSEMPSNFRAADLVALPSQFESWGMVVNEAMHCGVPCVVSTHVGCQQDLVIDGQTGWTFTSNDLESLTHSLRRALALAPEQRANLQTRIHQHMTKFTYAQTTAGLVNALDHVRKRHG